MQANIKTKTRSWLAIELAIVAGAVITGLIVMSLIATEPPPARAGETDGAAGYKVLEPIRHGNLTVFPVLASKSYPTGEFLTLDEGLRSGEVVVTEYGSLRGLIRRHPMPPVVNGNARGNAQVNRLVLVNNSKRPLLLLAGEIVTGARGRGLWKVEELWQRSPEGEGITALGAVGDHGRGAGLRPARNGHPAVSRPGRVGRFEAGVDQQVLAHRLRISAGITEDQPATLTSSAVTDQPTRTVGGIGQVEPTIDQGVKLLTNAAVNPILF